MNRRLEVASADSGASSSSPPFMWGAHSLLSIQRNEAKRHAERALVLGAEALVGAPRLHFHADGERAVGGDHEGLRTLHGPERADRRGFQMLRIGSDFHRRKACRIAEDQRDAMMNLGREL